MGTGRGGGTGLSRLPLLAAICLKKYKILSDYLYKRKGQKYYLYN
jgi:hypothetical protein